MAKQIIQTGSSANDGTGDSIRVGAQKINANFTELYNSVYTLPTAGVGSEGRLGGVKVDGTTITVTDGIISSTAGYILPTATTSVLGGVKIDGVTITKNNLNQLVSAQYALPIASANTLGGIKVGSGLSMNNGVLSSTGGYSLPTASTTVLGGVKIDGSTITLNGYNQLVSVQYSLPTASTTILGGVKVDGTTITINGSGIISGANTYTLPTASTTILGGVKIDGSTITLNGSNQLVSTQYSLPTATTSLLGGVKVDGSTITISSGVISAAGYSLPTATTSVLGGVKVDGTSISITDGVISSSGSTPSRTTASVTSASLTAGSSGTYTITGFKGYALLKIQTSSAAWVTLYTDTAARTSDSSRLEIVDPLPGSGVVAEVITTGAETIVISPGTIGFSNEGTPTTSIPIKIVNKGVSSTTITVTLTLLKLEN
jgi:hypothetical protein